LIDEGLVDAWLGFAAGVGRHLGCLPDLFDVCRFVKLVLRIDSEPVCLDA
jgi:hypothetical protein